MPSQVVPDVVKLEARYDLGEQSGIVENVFYAEMTTRDEAALTALCNNYKVWEAASAAPMRSAQCNLVELVATDVSSLTGLRLAVAVDPVIPGTGGSVGAPASVTVAVHANINNRGRGKSGRKFWVGLPDAKVERSSLIATAGPAIVAAMNALAPALAPTSGFVALVVPHFVVAGARPLSVAFSTISSWSMTDFFIDVQKLRLPNHKKHKKPRP